MFQASLAHHQGVQMYKKKSLGHTIISDTRNCGGSGDDSINRRLFCTNTPLDDGPVKPETCRSFVN